MSARGDWDFGYTGSIQEFAVPSTGTYQLEVWGAQGGDASPISLGGNGGYSAVRVDLQKDDVLGIAVGGAGGGTGAAGWNGGGSASGGSSSNCGGGGGSFVSLGASYATFASFSSSQSAENYYGKHLLVAAGGGGGGCGWSEKTTAPIGCPGGGLDAPDYTFQCAREDPLVALDQLLGGGYRGGKTSSRAGGTGDFNGGFGRGANSRQSSCAFNAAGGGGLYGGAGLYGWSSNMYTGTGGSGYLGGEWSDALRPISWSLGVNGWSDAATSADYNDATKFKVPSTDGSGYERGHRGDGFVRITKVG